MITLGDMGPRCSGCAGGLAAQLLPKPPLAGHLPAARHHSQADPTLSAPKPRARQRCLYAQAIS